MVYRMTTLHTQKDNTLPVIVIVWYPDKHILSVHREGEKPQVISSVDVREQSVHVNCMLYHSHSLCSLEVIQLEDAVETSVDHSVMWTLNPQCALQLITYLIARDMPVPWGKDKDDREVHKTVSLFSALRMSLAYSRGSGHKKKKTLALCTRYDGHYATTYVHAVRNGKIWESVDEEMVASRDARLQVLDIYTGISMSDGKAPLLKIPAKQTAGMIDGKYVRTETVRKLLLEMTDEFFTDACTATPFCCVDENMNYEGQDNRLTLCLASKPNDDYIQQRLRLHRFVKANMSRSLNALIEAVLAEH